MILTIELLKIEMKNMIIVLLEKDLSKWITKDLMNELGIDEDKKDDVENDVYCAFDLELCQNISYYISLFYERSYIDDEIKELLSECVEL